MFVISIKMFFKVVAAILSSIAVSPDNSIVITTPVQNEIRVNQSTPDTPNTIKYYPFRNLPGDSAGVENPFYINTNESLLTK